MEPNTTKSTDKQPMTETTDRTILIVEDDYYFRTLLEKTLSLNSHKVTTAENGKQAQQILGLQKINLVISDIRMPEITGTELLTWIKSNHRIPVILMTGFSEIIETIQAERLGADGFLPKPFKTEELLELITEIFKKKDEEALQNKPQEEENLDETFNKTNIEEIVSGKNISFDLYVRIRASKYIKIAHAGDPFPASQIETLRGKDIKHLYMRKDDFKRYLGFTLNLTQAVTSSKNLSHQKKVAFLKHTSETLLQNMYDRAIEKEDFEISKELVSNSVSIISEDQNAADLLEILATHTDYLYAHSVAVSLYACLIGKALGWTSTPTMYKLAMGGLMHDIGKKEISKEILQKPRVNMTSDEVAIFETHPARGAEIMAKIEGTPMDLLQIIHHHHENCLGRGYPSKLKRSEIHPLAKVVTVASDFCNFVIKNPNSMGLKPEDAVKRMLNLDPKVYDTQTLKALLKIFKIKYPNIS